MIDLIKIQNVGQEYGPLQIVHDFKFAPLNRKEDYSFIDGMDEKEKLEYITHRMEKLYHNGCGGIVINVDFKNYLEDDEAFLLLGKIVHIACDIGLKLWLYDEQYYPSGAAGGLVLKNHPELEGQGLVCVKTRVKCADVAVRIPSPLGHSELRYAFAVPIVNTLPDFNHKIDIKEYKDVAGGLCWDPETGEWDVYCFFTRVLYEMTYLPISFRACRRYPDIANKKAIERFIEVTYRKYEKYLGSPLGDKIEAVFTDEPSLMFYRKYPENRDVNKSTKYKSLSIFDRPNLNIPSFPYIPWNHEMPSTFYKQYGYTLPECLPEIFDEGDHTRKYRYDFYSMISKMVEEAYLGTIKKYVNSQNVLVSGHYLAEEEFGIHPFIYGDILRHLGEMNIPGCDILCSSPNKIRYSLACKLASSAAHIYERDHAMVEASNMLDDDQNYTLDDMFAAMSTIFSHGINIITSYYCEELFTDEETKSYTSYVARLNKLFSDGKNRISALLYYPFEQLCADRIPAASLSDVKPEMDALKVQETVELLFKNQIGFDFINKEKLLESEILDQEILTSYGEKVGMIVFPNISFVDHEISVFLEKAHYSGLEIVFYGQERAIEGIGFPPVFCVDATKLHADNFLDFKSEDYCPYMTYIHRVYDDSEIYMINNTGDETIETNIHLYCKGQTVDALNLINDVCFEKVNYIYENNHLKVRIVLKAHSAKILYVY